ncbi:MAG: hypothetical protein V3T17_08880 [Pseudomonadales bacterium]
MFNPCLGYRQLKEDFAFIVERFFESLINGGSCFIFLAMNKLTANTTLFCDVRNGCFIIDDL